MWGCWDRAGACGMNESNTWCLGREQGQRDWSLAKRSVHRHGVERRHLQLHREEYMRQGS